MISSAPEKLTAPTEPFGCRFPAGTKARLEKFRREEGHRTWTESVIELINRGLNDFPA